MSKPKNGFSRGLWAVAALIAFFGVDMAHGDARETEAYLGSSGGPNPALQDMRIGFPDLVISSITKHFVKETDHELHGYPYKRTEYRVRVRVENRGTGKAGTFNVRVENRSHYPGGHTEVFQEAAVLKCAGLAPGASTVLSVPRTFWDTDAGAGFFTLQTTWYCFRATADPENRVKELNTKNNTLIQTDCRNYLGKTTLSKPNLFPDLVISSIAKHFVKETDHKLHDYPYKRTEYRVRIRVQNIGNLKAGPFKVRVERQRNYPGGPAEAFQEVAVLNCGELAPGASTVLSVPGTFWDTDAGRGFFTLQTTWYCFRATADPENKVKELNTKNNILVQTDCRTYIRAGRIRQP